MPPRYAYWTILVDDQPTAFRAGAKEDLLPTFNRLKEKQPSAKMMWFQNGKLMESFFSDGGPLTLDDVNNWLGRSNFGNDGNLSGMFNEFRVYDYALSQRQIVGNFLAGPDTVIPEPGSALLLGLGAMLLGNKRRRKP